MWGSVTEAMSGNRLSLGALLGLQLVEEVHNVLQQAFQSASMVLQHVLAVLRGRPGAELLLHLLDVSLDALGLILQVGDQVLALGRQGPRRGREPRRRSLAAW